MSPAADHLLKTKANKAAADTSESAVALREHSAAFVSFQRHQPVFPPTQNVDSAVSPVSAAVQFSGSIAQTAKNVANCALNVGAHGCVPSLRI